jgi:uncharacterized membrane protein YphA (DoxX/SURF4 family)
LVGIVTGVLLIASGSALVANWRASRAATWLGAFLLSWLVFLHLPRFVAHPGNGGVWVPAAEVLAMCAGAWMLASALSRDGGDAARAHIWRRVAVSARLAFGISLLAFGLSHFLYLEYVEVVIPAWIPAHRFWAYAIGVAHVAAGLSLLTRIQARLATAMLAVMFGSWVFVVHVPRVMAANGNKDEWTSLMVAIAMCGGSWLFSACLALAQQPEAATRDPGAAGPHPLRWIDVEPLGRPRAR